MTFDISPISALFILVLTPTALLAMHINTLRNERDFDGTFLRQKRIQINGQEEVIVNE